MSGAGALLPEESLAVARRDFDDAATASWCDAQYGAALLAVDPAGLGGVSLCAAPGPVRDRWLAGFCELWPRGTPIKRLPVAVGEDRLLGGIDLTATLSAGRPIMEHGILAQAHGGVVIAAMAERMSIAAAAHMAGALDQCAVHIEREGASRRDEARFAAVLLDESVEREEAPPAVLLARLAFRVDLHAVSVRASEKRFFDRAQIDAARTQLPHVSLPDDILIGVNEAAMSFGFSSIRVLQYCMKAARAAAALQGRERVSNEDAALGCRLVLEPLAGGAVADVGELTPAPDSGSDKLAMDGPDNRETNPSDIELQDGTALPDEMVIDILKGAALANPLAQMQSVKGLARRPASAGRSGQATKSRLKGRPLTPRKGDPHRDGRLDVLASLRAAAPWQRLRGGVEVAGANGPFIRVRPEDFHVKRYKQRSESTVIFVVDASGSSAMNRMAEAKGAVERLLSDCYARRDYVAVIAFRAAAADIILAPTRSLVRARRELAALPGGGGTPLAAGIEAAALLARAEQSKGRTPYIVFLSDGRANIALNGEPGREEAQADGLNAAKRLSAVGAAVLFFDTSPRVSKSAQEVSAAMGASYQPLPFVDGGVVSKAVRQRVDAGQAGQ